MATVLGMIAKALGIGAGAKAPPKATKPATPRKSAGADPGLFIENLGLLAEVDPDVGHGVPAAAARASDADVALFCKWLISSDTANWRQTRALVDAMRPSMRQMVKSLTSEDHTALQRLRARGARKVGLWLKGEIDTHGNSLAGRPGYGEAPWVRRGILTAAQARRIDGPRDGYRGEASYGQLRLA